MNNNKVIVFCSVNIYLNAITPHLNRLFKSSKCIFRTINFTSSMSKNLSHISLF